MAHSSEHHGRQDRPQIEDPENYNLRRRLQQIHDRKENVPTTIREESRNVVEDPRNTNGITEERYRELVKDAVIDYIVELEPLMTSDEHPLDQDYWKDVGIELEATDGEISLEELVESNGYVDGPEGEQPLDIATSRRAYRVANRFLSRAGFGLKFDGSLPHEEDFTSV